MMSVLSSTRRLLRGMVCGFSREERGSIAVEAVLILPMLFWTYLTLFASFHAYRTYTLNQKAAYTIGDMISRETNPLDADYMTGARELLGYLVNGAREDVAVRVTQVKYDAEQNKFNLIWAMSKGFKPQNTQTDVNTWTPRLPTMPDGEQVIVVETAFTYTPPFDVGFTERNVENFVFTRSRYTPGLAAPE
jgi:Flp pilus assembly protein TadG